MGSFSGRIFMHLVFLPLIVLTMTTFLDTDPEIQEAMDELDEEEITPIDESVSTLLFDQNLSEDWFYTVEEDQDHAVEEEDQDPVVEE
jgi:hypothetical protein